MFDCPQCGIIAASGHRCPPTYIQQLQAENTRLRAELASLNVETDLQADALHVLVCNAYGYDKSIVRALALQVKSWAQHQVVNRPEIVELAARVLAAEEQAGRISHCSDHHADVAALDTATAEAPGAEDAGEG
jgi:hypothetical protein